MTSQKDNYSFYDENGILELAMVSVMGDREDQQDFFGYELKENEGLIAVCDGMGGHSGGKTASRVAINHILEKYIADYPVQDPCDFLADAADECDSLVAGLKNNDGEFLRAGSTMVSVFIRNNEMYRLSVGDSRLYFMRDDKLVQISTDHTYKYELDKMLGKGLLTEAEYAEKIGKGEMLVSFLGQNGLRYADSEAVPLKLTAGDKILLISDGLYKIVSDEGICAVLQNFNNINDAVNALESKSKRYDKKIKRDNTTIVLIKIK